MPIITLTTDWNNDDFYIGAIKGLLYSKCPSDVNIVDITHKIESFKYTQAAFILKNVFSVYPKGTIHIIGVNSDYSKDHPHVCLKIKDQIFLGTSNGIFSLMFEDEPDIIVEIKETEIIKRSTFPELTVLAETAAFLLNGGDIKQLGNEVSDKHRYISLMPAFDEKDIVGSVIYIDSYKNIITNISKELFDKIRNNRKFKISVKSDIYTIDKISNNYSEVEQGDILAVFNSLGLLEIAQRNGQIAQIIDININAPVIVKFI